MQAISSFFSRNRRRITTLAGIAGGVYLLGKYAQYKIEELKKKTQLEMAAKEKCVSGILNALSPWASSTNIHTSTSTTSVKMRFQRNLDDCLLCILSELPILTEHVFGAFPVEHATALIEQQSLKNAENIEEEETEEMKQERLQEEKKRKMELWQELKILCFSRTISAIYLVSILSSLLYTQLNLIGRYIYVDSVISFSQKDAEFHGKIASTLPPNLDRQYLSLSWHFMNLGWKRIVDVVRKAVEESVGSLPLSTRVTPETLQDIITNIRSKIEQRPILPTNYPSSSSSASEFSTPLQTPSSTTQTSPALQGTIPPESMITFLESLLPTEGHEFEALRNGGAFPDLNGSSETLNADMDNAESHITPKLQSLINETRDLFETNDFALTLQNILDSSFSLLNSSLSNRAFSSTESVLLPKLFPFLKLEAQVIMQGVPNTYVETIRDSKWLRAWCAVVFSECEEFRGC